MVTASMTMKRAQPNTATTQVVTTPMKPQYMPPSEPTTRVIANMAMARIPARTTARIEIATHDRGVFNPCLHESPLLTRTQHDSSGGYKSQPEVLLPLRFTTLVVPALLSACTSRPAVAPAPAAPVAPADPTRTTAGFVDAHGHPASLGRSLGRLQLGDCSSLAEVQDRVADRAATDEGWLLGRGWDQNDWSDHTGFPAASDLDAHTGERPTALSRVDGHALWLNTAGLAAAAITAETPDPPGGRILRGEDGKPTGVLIDAAIGLLSLPQATAADRRAELERGLTAIAASGLTGVHAMGVSDLSLSAYEALDAEGELRVRIFAYLGPDTAAAARLRAEGPWCGTRLCVVGIKRFADGALGSRGALLSADYSDEPGHRGLSLTSTDDLAAEATALLRVGAQLAVHAIGDEGVHQTLDAFETARAAVPEAAALPLRLEHAQVVRPEDLARLVPLNVVASMQPTHATSDMPWAPDRLGPDRVPWSYGWRRVLDSGAVLAFGSDFPVENVSPSHGLWSATTRADLDGLPAGGWMPDQLLDLDEATHAFTVGTWEALGGGAVDRAMPADDATIWVGEARGPGTWWTATETIVAGETIWSAGS